MTGAEDTWGALRSAVQGDSDDRLMSAIRDHFREPRDPVEVEYAIREWLRRGAGLREHLWPLVGERLWPLVSAHPSAGKWGSRMLTLPSGVDPLPHHSMFRGWEPDSQLNWVVPMDPAILGWTEAVAFLSWVRMHLGKPRSLFAEGVGEAVPPLQAALRRAEEHCLHQDPSHFLDQRHLIEVLNQAWQTYAPSSDWGRGWRRFAVNGPLLLQPPGYLADLFLNKAPERRNFTEPWVKELGPDLTRLLGRWGGRFRPGYADWLGGLAQAQRRVFLRPSAALEFVIRSAVDCLGWQDAD